MEHSDLYPKATEHDLFEENEFVNYELASNNQRFFNYLIDALLMRFVLGIASGYLLAKFLMATTPDTAYWLFNDDNLAAGYLIGLLNHLIYYSICESVFKGRTLGKLITRTKAIREDGNDLTFKDAFMRSLCRLVPFEALSIWFGSGLWHDTWTRTRVIQVQ